MGWVALFSHQKQAERTYFFVQLVEPTGVVFAPEAGRAYVFFVQLVEQPGVTQEGVAQQYTKELGFSWGK